jgi:predicted homoserine dehydrogenase-like protein
MIIVDTALQKREAQGNPVKVAMTGAGYMGRGIALQIEKYVTGMQLVVISNRTVSQAKRAYKEAGIESVNEIGTVAQLEDSIRAGEYAVTYDPALLCKAEGIEAIIEATGDVEYSAPIAMKAIENKKHLILMNAELDATVGPILKVYADRAGVVISNADGDQPGVMMNLFRFVKSIGYRPVLAGNIKGLQDHYRTPETQRGFAKQHNITPMMATSFADGTKISMENAVVANATGFKVGRRGMYGPECAHVKEAVDLFPKEQMLEYGLVDYVLGAEPGPGVFIIGYNEHPIRQGYMRYFKMGDGPFYVFYVPYHLPHLEVPLTAARAVLFQDAAVTPNGRPVCDVITIAKRNLTKGETLDGIGGFTCYGVIDNADVSRKKDLLPMGISDGCLLKKDLGKDQVIKISDIERPAGRLCDKLRSDQDAYFFNSTT